jgi:hypothetical protein
MANTSTFPEFWKRGNERIHHLNDMNVFRTACGAAKSDPVAGKAVDFLEQSRYAEFTVHLTDPPGGFIQIHPCNA